MKKENDPKGKLLIVSDTLPPTEELSRTDEIPQREIEAQKRTEEELSRHREHLEALVAERTAELLKANEQLQREITERKRAEEALRESENRYKMISELMSDYVFKLRIKADGQIVMDFATDSFYSITGRTLEDAKTPDLWTKIFHPDDLGRKENSDCFHEVRNSCSRQHDL